MYNWYYWATECYVYLSDVSIDTKDSLAWSRWFTRGWTLQELLAPEVIRYFDQHWRYIGNKGDLAGPISILTGIEEQYIKHRAIIHTASVAARMSWASGRETTRSEDEAYCLMGLFDVNMPLLYGEGSLKVFQRLQHEIIKVSEDESLFAWHDSTTAYQTGIFAPHPWAFCGCGDIEPVEDPRIRRMSYSITSRGLSISATYQTVPFEQLQGLSHSWLGVDPGISECLLLPLKCARKVWSTGVFTDSRHNPERLITIILAPVSGHHDNVFFRCLSGEISVYKEYFQPNGKLCHRNIYIKPPSGLTQESWLHMKGIT